MLYNAVVTDDSTTYVPTALGNVLLAVVIIALLAAAVLLARKKTAAASGKMSARQLAYCAAAIALGTVLSNIKLFSFPWGGSITLLSMLVICLPGYWFGLGAGLLVGIAYGILQILFDPYILYPAQLIVDYLLAFGALGLSGLFCRSKNGLVKGYLAAVLGRYVFAVISGWLFFASYAWEGWPVLPYSLVYNGIYIFAEAAITLMLLSLPPVRNAMARVKQTCTQDLHT